jgi:hypothetical protein
MQFRLGLFSSDELFLGGQPRSAPTDSSQRPADTTTRRTFLMRLQLVELGERLSTHDILDQLGLLHVRTHVLYFPRWWRGRV